MAAPCRTYRDFSNSSSLLLLHQNTMARRVVKALKSLRIFPANFAGV
jgi:hypothetical protein